MSRLLPLHPDLDHLKNEAKALLKAHGRRDPSVCPQLRRLHRFAAADDATILSAEVALTEMQFALALDYGYVSWEALRQVVAFRRPLPGSDAPIQSDAILLPNPPAPRGDANRLTAALHLALAYCGAQCDYDTLAGDSGMAFILQADTQHGARDGDTTVLNLGWWPIDGYGAMLRLDFLRRVYGIPLRPVHCEAPDEYRQDAAKYFQTYHLSEIRRSLQAGRPLIGEEHDIWLITGYDGGKPPVLGQLTCSDVPEVKRLGRHPWGLIVIDEPIEPTIERTRADGEAIQFAIDLHHDRHGWPQPNKLSGRGAFALWSEVLRDGQRCGPDYFSGNVRNVLRSNRRSVPPYLRQMAQRHGPSAAGALRAAADIYEQVLAKLRTIDVFDGSFATAAGREKLAALVDDVAGLEARAVQELQNAVTTMA